MHICKATGLHVLCPIVRVFSTLQVKPDSGYWKGASYDFTFTIPALYPHDPPKVRGMSHTGRRSIPLLVPLLHGTLRHRLKPDSREDVSSVGESANRAREGRKE